MLILKSLGFSFSVALLASTAFAEPISNARPPGVGGGGGDDGGGGGAVTGIYYDWMSFGINSAWADRTDGLENLGQKVEITVIDDFQSKSKIRGDLGDGQQRLRHGEWTSKQANMLAPLATMNNVHFGNDQAITLSAGFNVLNLSFRENEPIVPEYALYNLETSILTAAKTGDAFIAKSAGNGYGAAVGYNTIDGGKDYLSLGLIADFASIDSGLYNSTIFAGAMNNNVVGEDGILSSEMASYSNIAGDDLTVQRQFLVVGVESAGTGLAGTSFAAPIIAGYASVLSSKWPGASPVDVAQQLLTTAQQDSFGTNYNAAIHGQGEANISRAISPWTVN